MSTEVLFEIFFEDISKNHLISKLNSSQLKVLPYSIKDIGEIDDEPDCIACEAVFPKEDAIPLFVGKINSMKQINGVKGINMVSYKLIEDKKHWYNHFTIPLLISIIGDFLIGFIIMETVAINHKIVLELYDDYVLLLIIPAVMSFLTGISYIYYRNRNLL
jgi:hypothetical protein